MNFVNPPWTALTPQEQGRVNERRVVRERGGREHPGSGSGRIKHDGSTDEEVIEVKTARRSFTLSRSYIAGLFTVAVRQGKRPTMVVDFPGYRCVITVERTKE